MPKRQSRRPPGNCTYQSGVQKETRFRYHHRMIDLHLDLMTQDNYLSSLALLRQKITNGRMKKNLPCALRIAVQLPDGKAELFIQSSNLYLIGFLGGNNKVLTLEMQVSRSEDLAEALIRNSGRLDKGEQIVKSGLGADHAALGR